MDNLTVFNNRYQVLAKIGEGGLAEVYRAQDVALGRLVAVKALRCEYVLDPAFLGRFHREAQSAAGLTHPNIVAVYDFGQDQERPYIVMEYVPGRDLSALLQKGPVSIKRAVDICVQVCAGVGYAHKSGLVHGDLKPGNILVAPDRRVKVVDFGLARALGESAMDEDGALVWGTPAYFSPEQAVGGQVSQATDVYAIGVILYEMLVGRLPFSGSDSELAQRHLYDRAVPVNQVNPRVPSHLARIVDAALAKQPEERFATANEMGQALAVFRRRAEGQTGYGEPVTPVRTGGVDWVAVVLGLLVLIAILGLVPLWVAVYRGYARPLAPSAPTATVAVSPGQVRVPDIIGMEVEDGRRVLAGEGLNLEVIDQSSHPTVPAFSIVEQTVRAGMPVEMGATVGVVVSQGPQLVEVPAMVGRSLGEAQSQMHAVDLPVEIERAWSEQPPGTVIDQDPPGGSLVRSRSLVVLTVSSGTQVPVGARLGNSILLVTYELPRLIYDPGDSLPITFVWQAIASPGEGYMVFLHLTRADGSVVTQQDGLPVGGTQPTDTWSPGTQIIDARHLAIPADTPPGEYWLRVGLYNDAGRLPVTDPGQVAAVDDALVLGSIWVD